MYTLLEELGNINSYDRLYILFCSPLLCPFKCLGRL